MFGSQILEVAIGLVLVYFSVSLICSGIKEFFAKITGLRAKTLEESLVSMLNHPDLVKQMLGHPFVKDISMTGIWKKVFSKTPAGGSGSAVTSITKENFSRTLLHVLKDVKDEKGDISKAIDSIGNPVVKNILQKAQTKGMKTASQVERFLMTERAEIEKWFDNEMVKLSAWYKKKSRQIIMVVAALICIGFNIDTFTITKTFYKDNAMRQAVTDLAEKYNAQQPPAVIKQIRKDLEDTDLNLHWNYNVPQSEDPWGRPEGWGWVLKIFGLLITISAVSLGAPFWYDILMKLVNLRKGTAGGGAPNR